MSLPDDPWVMTVQAAHPGPAAIDEGEVRRALSLLVDPAHSVQVQALPSGRWRHCPGADLEAIVRAVRDLADEKGLYFSLNPFRGPLDGATRNRDVLGRRWFLIDPDAIKPGDKDKDSSTTDAEKEAARVVTEDIRAFLRDRGWPDPIYVDSGNNWQLLYRVDLPNDKLSQQILRRGLMALGERFDNPGVKLDRGVHDARRICKIPGTMVRKGPNTPERPHRVSRLMSVPMSLTPVPVELLKDLAGLGEVSPAVATAPDYVELPEPYTPARDVWQIPAGGDARGAYARSALEREVGRVATATAPGRNELLYESALKLGTLVGAGLLDEGEVRAKLAQAAHACGLGQDGDPREVRRAIENGFAIGVANPREVPDRVKGKKGKEANVVGEVERPKRDPSKVLAARMSKVAPSKVNWLWPNRIPFGYITIFAGRTGLGKSFVTCDIVARLTRGDEWPDSKGECIPPGNVLMISEDPEDTILAPRLIELEADLDRVFYMTWEAMATYTLVDTDMLGIAVSQAEDPDLIVIDPPTNFLGDTDEHKNAEVRSVVMRLASWIKAHPRPIAVILITHVNKGSGGKDVDALSRVIGSVAWVTTSRIAHMFAPDASAPDQVLFTCPKTNIGVKPSTLAFKIARTETLAKVEWLGEVDISADAAMAGEKKRPITQDAAEWIKDRFRERREWRSEELKETAFQAGHTANAIFKNPIIMAYPIRKSPQHTADGTKYWTWTAQPGWPPDLPPPNGDPKDPKDPKVDIEVPF